jgi:hypothetical protein
LNQCPSCRTIHEGQPNFCGKCGFEFQPQASPSGDRGPLRELAASRKRLTGLQKLILGALAIGSTFAISLYIGAPSGRSGLNSNSNAGAHPATQQAPANGSRADIGETLTVQRAKGFWVCASTPDALREMLKWVVADDQAEVKRTMVRTHSIAVNGGMKVKVLDIGFGKRKIRVLTNDAGEMYLRDEKGAFPADPRIGRECWVPSEALAR